MLVRDAVAADLERVSETKVASWRDTYSPLLPAPVLAPFLDERSQLEYIRAAYADKGTLLLVAEGAGGTGVVGFALTHVDEEPDPWLESLHVLAQHRSRGTGAALVRATAVRLRALGRHTMRLGVVAGNDRAMRFYERLGAEHIGHEPAAWATDVRHELYRWPDISVLEEVV
ncbi:MAG TPA: GNAT family N-acetyltransferase [Candidatus Dormibacteraeota bacterium]|nr:GNAT family N-acetyltransferase [Candidatus Dormibacteraeota bacterium]